jgi:hypothetical protein
MSLNKIKKLKSTLMKDTAKAIWTDRDLAKFSLIAAAIGFLVGVAVGFEWAWRPAVSTFRPLLG